MFDPADLEASLRLGANTVAATKISPPTPSETRRAWSAYCQKLLTPGEAPSPELDEPLNRLTVLERVYVASLVYALAQPAARRKRLAMFFTPPALSNYVLNRIEGFGADFLRGRFIDPAAGGASFVGPIVNRMLERGLHPIEILNAVRGVEIDPPLADFAREAIRRLLNRDAASVVTTGDGLREGAEGSFDGVIGNPPYRVLTPAQRQRLPDWARPALGGYANLYCAFILRGLRLLRPSGLMALLLPTSFITGSYFTALRRHVSNQAEVLAIDTIERRKEMFRGVSQDICLLVCRRSAGPPENGRAGSRSIEADLSWRCAGHYQITSGSGAPWILKSVAPSGAPGASLADYGYEVSCGPIVHNRDTGLIEGTRRRRKSAVPLVWGHVIAVGGAVAPASRNTAPGGGKATFVSTRRATPPVRTSAIVLQRITSRDQTRRIRAGFVDHIWIEKYGGFYAENHVVVVAPDAAARQLVDLKTLWRILSSESVDRRLRPLLSSNCVNVTALRALPLPNPDALLAASLLGVDETELEAILEEAYA